jgi:hypothetical protein
MIEKQVRPGSPSAIGHQARVSAEVAKRQRPLGLSNLQLHCRTSAFRRFSKALGLTRFFGRFLIAVGMGLSARAQNSVTLAWDASTSATVTGYRLYQGVESGTYTNTTDVGNVTKLSVPAPALGGTNFYAVKAYDSTGGLSDFSNEITYSVPVTNGSVTIALTSPTNGASYIAPATIPLIATVDPNGHNLAKVQFYNGATLVGEASSAPFSLIWSGVSSGSYNLMARVIYDGAATLDSAPINVVVAPVSSPTSITFAADSGIITAPFSISGGAVSQPARTSLSDGGRAVYTFNVATGGVYTVSALVNAPKNNADTFYVNIDGEPTDPMMIWNIPHTSGFASRTVSWQGDSRSGEFDPQIFSLSAGPHQLIVRGREANVQLGDITISPLESLPVPWQTVDIGGSGTPGSDGVFGSLYAVAGAGNLSGLTDNFRFAYQPLSADGEIKAQINSIQNAGSNGCVGLMIRESLTPGSSYTLLGVSPSGAFRWQDRTGTAAASSASDSGAGSPPNAWARLVRSGNSFQGYTSTDGANWTLVKSTTNTMASNIYIGLAVASGISTSLSTATFTNLTVVP